MTTIVVLATWRRSASEAMVVGVATVALTRRARFAVVLAALGAFCAVRAAEAYDDLHPDQLGSYRGWVTVVDEPRPASAATRVVVQIDGERFEAWIRGRAARLRVDTWRTGDQVWLSGERTPLADSRARRVAWQHVVGELVPETLGDRMPGRPLAVASNRVRRLVADATANLPGPDAGLARGLIIGDDRAQPAEMVQRFRESGLAHLCAVSGQNVAFVLAAAGPLLRRARPVPRLVVSIVLIGWFVVITRAEPSVLRAGVMAMLGALGFALGRERDPPRLLGVAVVALLLIDPLLVLSVGFWLSVGATAGVTILTPVLAPSLKALGPLGLPLAVTLGAQIGVALPSVLVFGRLSLVGLVANLAAVPIAGFVMLYGLPACLACGLLPLGDAVVMLPVGLGVRTVDLIARAAAAAEPPPPVGIASWSALALIVLVNVARRQRSGALDVTTKLPQ